MSDKRLPAREAIAVGRFSTPEQEEGDSIRRQQNSFARVCQRWELQPSSRWTIFDKGLSGFKGEHLSDKAELGKFLRALEAGAVRPDAYGRMPVLVWEAVDRMTRLPQLLATDLVRRFVNAGIAIVFDEADLWIDSSTIADKWIILQVLIDQAYQYSRRLSRRLKSSWQAKREAAVTSGERFNKRRPAWLDWKGGRFVPNAGEAAIRFIFERTAAGEGQRQVLRQLQEKYPPIGTSGRWNASYIQKVLSDRAVLGELHPKELGEDGERLPVGDKPIVGYYPAVIDEILWLQAQRGKNERKKMKGPNGQFINLFTGLLSNAHDGYTMHVQTTRRDGKIQRRLVSYGHLSGIEGADSVSVMYSDFESVLLHHLGEITPADFQPKGTSEALVEKELELAGVEKRIAELQAEMEDEDEELPPVRAAVRNLCRRAEGLAAEIDKLKQEARSDRPVEHAHSILAMLDRAEPEEQRTLRFQLRSLIHQIIDEIRVKPEKHYGRVYFLAQIYYKTGLVRQVIHGPGIGHGKSAQVPVEFFAFDLRNQKEANRRSVFAGLAKGMLGEEREIVVPAEVPEEVGGAAEVWIKVARLRIRKDSFRVVPSKIRRFVAFLGEDLPCRNVNTARWGRWVSWLKGEVAGSRLEDSTARVTYSRAREFVRWLQGKDLSPAIEGLEKSWRAVA